MIIPPKIGLLNILLQAAKIFTNIYLAMIFVCYSQYALFNHLGRDICLIQYMHTMIKHKAMPFHAFLIATRRSFKMNKNTI